MPDIKWEKLSDLLASGLAGHTQKQWLESGTDHLQVPIDVDWDHYRTLESSGVLKLLAARKDGHLIGYAVFFLVPHMMYRTTMHVMCDSIYVAPAHRGIGVALVRTAEKFVRQLAGKQHIRIIYSTPICGSFPKVLERLGYPARESVHVKVVGGNGS